MWLFTPKKINKLHITSQAKLPTKHGMFHILAFDDNGKALQDFAVMKGDVKNKDNVLVRIHSSCVTSESIGSLRCDCAEQLATSMEMIAEEKKGLIIYLQQEGRGVGIHHKIMQYALQDEGYDTVTAAQKLGQPVDTRNYHIAIGILQLLGIKSIRLITNNPEKIAQLTAAGITIKKVIHTHPTVTEHNKKYLETKANKLGHMLELKK